MNFTFVKVKCGHSLIVPDKGVNITHYLNGENVWGPLEIVEWTHLTNRVVSNVHPPCQVEVSEHNCTLLSGL